MLPRRIKRSPAELYLIPGSGERFRKQREAEYCAVDDPTDFCSLVYLFWLTAEALKLGFGVSPEISCSSANRFYFVCR